MSAASLNSFLQKVLNDLENTKSGPYRELVANRRPHLFQFNAQKLSGEVQLELLSSGVPISPADKKAIKVFADVFKTKLEGRLKGIAVQSGGKVKITKNTLKFTFTSNTVNNYAGQYSKPGDVFQAIKDFYRDPLKEFFTSVQNYLVEQTFINEETGRTKTKALRTKSGKKRQAAGRAIHAGHVDDAGIVQSIIADTLNNLIDVVGVVDDDGHQISEHDIKTDLEALGIDLSIMRNDSTDTHTIQLEAASDNTERGREIERKRKQLIVQLKKAIKDTAAAAKAGEGLEHLSGSDSLYEKKRKTAAKKVTNEFKKVMGAKVITEDLKIKKSSNKKETLTSSPRAAKGRKSSTPVRGSKLRAGTRTSTKRSAASEPLLLIQEFNRRLPTEIIKNMGDPALENRTGRFASSVRVVDILKTAKGFPSIGYTYQRSPYSTFETGGKQGNSDRDPRKLIDKTIREIAIDYAMGRLFTRRV